MSDTTVETPQEDHVVGSNGIDTGVDKTDIKTDNSEPVQPKDSEASADCKVKAIPSSDKSHAEKSSTKANKEHNNIEETKSPAKRKVPSSEKSSDDAEDSLVSPVKKKAKTESRSSETKGDAENSQGESEDEHDEEEDDEDDATAEPGLLERPVVLEAGVKREKKKTQRLDITPVMKKVEIVAGEGTKLGDLPGVEFHLARAPSENLKVLHRILYDRVGSAPVVKKNIRQFCGFGFVEGSAEYKKKHDKLSKLTNAQLKFICEVLHIERGGKKDEITDRILHYLLKPHDSGKPVPTSGKKKRRSSSAKGTSKKSKSEKPKPKAKKKVKGAQDEDESSGAEGEDSGDENEESDVGDQDMSTVESASGSDHEAKKKKKETKKNEKKTTPVKKSSKSVDKTPKSGAKKSSKKPAGDSTKKKAATPKKAKQVTVSSDDSSDEDSEPIKKSLAPTDDVLRNIIKKILKTANLEEVTMKTVCKQVYDKFPNFDLTSRKDFIKTTVKQILK